jgi:multiple sugar transport system permease protein
MNMEAIEVKYKKNWGARIGANIALIVIFAFFLFPIIWMIGMSFKTIDDILSWPPKFLFTPTLDNYRAILTSQVEVRGIGSIDIGFMSGFWHSLLISTGAVLVSVVLGVPTAYALSRFQFKGREDIAFTFLSFRFGPEMLVIIPIFFIFLRIGLNDSFIGLIWTYQLITMPMIIWIVRSYIDDVPVDFEEACVVDGYPRWKAVFKVLVPIIRPGIAASALLAFIYAWNNFIFALVLGSSRTNTVIMEAMKFVAAEALRYGIMCAGIVISFLPILLFSIFAQRYFVRGMSMGAIKR